jgi:hypothetical protein
MLKRLLPDIIPFPGITRLPEGGGAGWDKAQLKPREPRQKVMIKARMRAAASWNDVCILDISVRGLSMQAAAPPRRGTYVEIRCGHHAIMARVVWTKHHRFGARTQDPLVLDDIIHHSGRSAPVTPGATAGQPFDRRRAPRTQAERHEHSRILSRAMEFAAIGIFAASAAMATFGAVAATLQQPLQEASAVLGR